MRPPGAADRRCWDWDRTSNETDGRRCSAIAAAPTTSATRRHVLLTCRPAARLYRGGESRYSATRPSPGQRDLGGGVQRRAAHLGRRSTGSRRRRWQRCREGPQARESGCAACWDRGAWGRRSGRPFKDLWSGVGPPGRVTARRRSPKLSTFPGVENVALAPSQVHQWPRQAMTGRATRKENHHRDSADGPCERRRRQP
jgi:hypothetical protein